MNKILVLIFVTIAGFFTTLQAQNERIYLENGSVIVGYIAKQIPGKDITINSVQATVYQDGKELQIIDKTIQFDSLSQEWQNWATDHRAIEEKKGKKTVQLSEIIEKSDTILAKILEKGSIVKYQTFAKKEYYCQWSDIKYYAKDKRPVTLLSGLNDIVILKDERRFVGQIIENHPGEIIKIATDNQIVEVFNYFEINILGKEKLNSEQSIWEQSFLIDELSLKNTVEKIEGIIVEQTLGKEICIEQKDGNRRRVAIGDIVVFEKKLNPKYQPQEDVILQKGAVQLGSDILEFKEIPIVNNLFIIDQKNPSAIIKTNEDVIINANLEDSQALISIFKTKLEREKIGFLGMGKKEKQYEIFTYEDVLKNGISYTKSHPTALGTVKIVFNVQESGFYMIYIKGYDGFIVLKAIR